MRGPYVIVCRAHSGGRLLSESFIRNGIQMGNVHPDTKDTKSFAVRGNDIIRECIESSFEYYKIEHAHKLHLQQKMISCINTFVKNEIPFSDQPFGWKFGETLFTAPVLLDAVPTAKVIHLIRDGRDVMLSRIPARFDPNRFHEKFNKLIIFGDSDINYFKGHSLNEENIENMRTELEFLHWKTVVEYSKMVRQNVGSDRYLEIKYEDLCCHPVTTIQKVFDFIDVPTKQVALDWISENASTDRIGKWKHEECLIDFDLNSQSLLKEYGYL